MKRTVLFLTLAAAFALNAEEPPRNPFWPMDYEGMRYPITVEPRVKPKPKAVPQPTAVRTPKTVEAEQARVAEEAKAKAKEREEARRVEEERRWKYARNSLSFGSTMGFGTKEGKSYAIMINGRIYTVGNFISSNCGDLRFTWKIEAITPDGKIRLKRIKYGLQKTEPKP